MAKNLVETSTSNFDVIFLSYDEPNAEENWADLVKKVPWAKRVHGVKGFDAAHKACAELSETDNFITVEGDNKVDATFFDQTMEYNPNWVYSWAGKNYINGLIYGNGGLKLWPKQLVLKMKTHEKTNGIEFCWDLPYYRTNYNWYSISYNTGSPFQAFRVGFREGVKLSLNQGKKVEDFKEIWHGNLKRLMIWMTVGTDVENGVYAIYGSRLGFYMTNLMDFDISLVSNYDWFNEMWETEWLQIVDDDEKFAQEYRRLAIEIQDMNFPIANLGKTQSKFFKATVQNPVVLGLMAPEKDGQKYFMRDKDE